MIDGKQIRAIVKRFSSMEGVRGVIVCDQEGLPIQSDLDTETTEKTAAYITSLIGRARNICDALKEGELAFVRLETAKGEVMIANTEGLNLIVLK
jgi:predicted regulator of Ras-like GTPase activity (Roadblock/LC7/MglB family)